MEKKYRVRADKNEGARCPFCNTLLAFPERIKTETGEFTGGRCCCGVVYACDPTGHNVGEAYLDALIFACGGDWDTYYTLSPEDNYREAVLNYDLRTHTLWPVKDIRRDYAGKIVFVKLEINK